MEPVWNLLPTLHRKLRYEHNCMYGWTKNFWSIVYVSTGTHPPNWICVCLHISADSWQRPWNIVIERTHMASSSRWMHRLGQISRCLCSHLVAEPTDGDLYCWWFNQKSGINSPVEVGSLSHFLQGFSTIPGGWEWDFWTINSITSHFCRMNRASEIR